MKCTNCNQELPNEGRFCIYCGTPSDEKVSIQTETEHVQNKKPFLLGGIIVVVIALIVLGITFFSGRSVNETMELIADAYEKRDDEKLMKYMFPHNTTEEIKAFIKDKDIDIYKEFETVFGTNTNICDYKVINKKNADKDLEKDIENLLSIAKLDVEYNSVKIIVLSPDDKKENIVKVLSYKTGNKWYIVPGVLEYIVETRQEADIKTAQEIAGYVYESICEEASYKTLAPYWGVAISLEDVEYLPQPFQDEFASNKGGQDFEIGLKHTENGATGYAFKMFPDGGIEVYISSETKIDEWKVYPKAEPDYYTGIKDEVSRTDLFNEYSYARLLSSDSPINGYWQSDKAGMYIGYSVSGGDEGFTVYLQSQDFWVHVLHSCEYFTYSGGNGNIVFTGNTEYNNSVFDIQIMDKDTIKLVVKDVDCGDKIVNTAYTFKRAEITKKTLSELKGTWIEAGEWSGYFGTYDTKIALCNACGCIHEINNGENYHNDKFVSLYDGKTLHYLFPAEGLAPPEFGDIGAIYTGDMYSVEGNEISFQGYAREGGSCDLVYFREGSEEAKINEVLNGYYKYLNDNGVEYEGCELIYLDDDNIPELVCGYGPYQQLLTYTNNGVQMTSIDWGMAGFLYREGTGEFCFNGINGSIAHNDFFVYKNGKVRHIGSAEHVSYAGVGGTTEEFSTMDNSSVDEATYNTYIESFGEYESYVSCTYIDIYEAYRNLRVTE